MGKKKEFSKKELKKAWKDGGQTYSGAARKLNIGRRTFKNLWVESGGETSTKTRKTTTQQTEAKTPQFKDPEVQKIYEEYQQSTSLAKRLVLEHIAHIEQYKIRVASLESELTETKLKLEKAEKTLYNLKIGGL